jgi:hypothetical protein
MVPPPPAMRVHRPARLRYSVSPPPAPYHSPIAHSPDTITAGTSGRFIRRRTASTSVRGPKSLSAPRQGRSSFGFGIPRISSAFTRGVKPCESSLQRKLSKSTGCHPKEKRSKRMGAVTGEPSITPPLVRTAAYGPTTFVRLTAAGAFSPTLTTSAAARCGVRAWTCNMETAMSVASMGSYPLDCARGPSTGSG